MLYIDVRINDNKLTDTMKRINRFKDKIEDLTGTLAGFGEDSIVIGYMNNEDDKKENDKALLLDKGWDVKTSKRKIEVLLKKHRVGNGEVRYTKN